MPLEQITGSTGHFNSGLPKLVGPLWGKPRVASLLRAYLRRVQAVEDDVWEVFDRYTIAGADTARLDVLGRIIGQPRYWSDDEIYRAVIRGKIRANRSRGLTDDIVEVVQAVTPTDLPVYVEHFVVATAFVWTDAPVNEDSEIALKFLLPKTRAAGVQLHFAWVDTADGLLLGDVLDATVGGDLGDTTNPGDGATLYSVATL